MRKITELEESAKNYGLMFKHSITEERLKEKGFEIEEYLVNEDENKKGYFLVLKIEDRLDIIQALNLECLNKKGLSIWFEDGLFGVLYVNECDDDGNIKSQNGRGLSFNNAKILLEILFNI